MSGTRKPRIVLISKTARKGIEALPERAKAACRNLIREIASGAEREKKLKGDFEGLRSVRVGRNHRLVYAETSERILVVDVGPRGDIYKR